MSYGTRYAGDPRWITCRRPGKCKRCEAAIQRGDRAFYYPKGSALYCDREGCGRACERDFEAAAFDESVMTGEF